MMNVTLQMSEQVATLCDYCPPKNMACPALNMKPFIVFGIVLILIIIGLIYIDILIHLKNKKQLYKLKHGRNKAKSK